MAQALTVSATLIPVGFNRLDAVVQLVSVMATASAVIPGLSLAIASRLPVISGGKRARSVVAGSLMLLGVAAAIGAVIGLLVPPARAFCFATAILVLAQGSYTVSSAIATRDYDYARLMWMRLTYGIAVVAGTVGACVANLTPYEFVIAPVIASFLAAWLGVWGRARVYPGIRQDLAPANMWRQFTGSRSLTFSQILSGYSGQVGAIVSAALGPYAAPWAVAVRFTAGFQTVATQIIAPTVDIDVARSVREPSEGALSRAVRRGSVVGAILASVSAPIVVGLALLLAGEGIRQGNVLPLLFGIVGYQVFSVWLLPSERVMGLLGGQRMRLRWDALRALTLLPVLFIDSDSVKVIWLGGVGLTFYTAYMALCRRLAGGVKGGRHRASGRRRQVVRRPPSRAAARA